MIDTRIGPRGRWIRLVVAPVGALALVGLAACGTGTDTSTTSAGTSSSAAAQPSTADDGDDADDADDVDSDLADYRSCLEDNGVTMPEPPSGAAGGPAAGWHSAVGCSCGGRWAGRSRRDARPGASGRRRHHLGRGPEGLRRPGPDPARRLRADGELGQLIGAFGGGGARRGGAGPLAVCARQLLRGAAMLCPTLLAHPVAGCRTASVTAAPCTTAVTA